jgi:hypothetical protein
LLLIIENWFSCIKLYTFCLYSSVVSITVVFPLSAFVMVSSSVNILFLIFVISFQSVLLLVLFRLYSRLIFLNLNTEFKKVQQDAEIQYFELLWLYKENLLPYIIADFLLALAIMDMMTYQI